MRRWAWLALPAVFLMITVAWFGCQGCAGEREQYGLQPTGFTDFAVVLIHGLDEPGRVWDGLLPHLQEQDVPVVEFRYPNDQDPARSARLLTQSLRDADLRAFVLVGHSMGCLVVRHALAEPRVLPGAGALAARCRGFLQLAPPNHGSNLARFRAALELQEWFLRLGDPELAVPAPIADGDGEAGRAITPGSPFLQQLNKRQWPEAIPTAIVIGYDSPVDFKDEAVKRERLRLLLEEDTPPDFLLPEILDGYGDGSVSVASALLPGVEEYHLVDAQHRPLTLHPDTLGLVDAYLRRWMIRAGDSN